MDEKETQAGPEFSMTDLGSALLRFSENVEGLNVRTIQPSAVPRITQLELDALGNLLPPLQGDGPDKWRQKLDVSAELTEELLARGKLSPVSRENVGKAIRGLRALSTIAQHQSLARRSASSGGCTLTEIALATQSKDDGTARTM